MNYFTFFLWKNTSEIEKVIRYESLRHCKILISLTAIRLRPPTIYDAFPFTIVARDSDPHQYIYRSNLRFSNTRLDEVEKWPIESYPAFLCNLARRHRLFLSLAKPSARFALVPFWGGAPSIERKSLYL